MAFSEGHSGSCSLAASSIPHQLKVEALVLRARFYLFHPRFNYPYMPHLSATKPN